MVTLFRYINYSILIAIALYTGFLFQQSSHFKTLFKKNDYHADAFLENVVAINMDKYGAPHSQIKTKKIIHYPANDTAFITQPLIILYSKDEEMPWLTTAEKGISEHGKEKILLIGNVKIHQESGPNNKEETILTSELTIYPKNDLAKTDKPVTFIEPGTIVNAVGMNAFLKEKRVQLLSKTRGEHEKLSN